MNHNQRSDPAVLVEALREALLQVMDQADNDLSSAHAEICKLQGLDAKTNAWPEWSPQANSIRWHEQLRGKFALAAYQPAKEERKPVEGWSPFFPCSVGETCPQPSQCLEKGECVDPTRGIEAAKKYLAGMKPAKEEAQMQGTQTPGNPYCKRCGAISWEEYCDNCANIHPSARPTKDTRNWDDHERKRALHTPKPAKEEATISSSDEAGTGRSGKRNDPVDLTDGRRGAALDQPARPEEDCSIDQSSFGQAKEEATADEELVRKLLDRGCPYPSHGYSSLRECLRQKICHPTCQERLSHKAASRLQSLLAEKAELREALRPFAARGNELPDALDDFYDIEVTVGELRNAFLAFTNSRRNDKPCMSEAELRERVVEECIAKAKEMRDEWGNANGSARVQGMWDQGNRIMVQLRALAKSPPVSEKEKGE